MKQGFTNIRASFENRDTLLNLKRRVSADTQTDFGMGELIGILVIMGERHYHELISVARERLGDK